jgi:polysaccharide chain length determinant protein (PEP-CTERM system associated)
MEKTEGSIDKLLDAWRRRKWLALVGLAMVLAPGATFVGSLPDLYRSTATVMVEPQGMADFTTGSLAEMEARLQMINMEILSRARLLELIERFSLYPELSGQSQQEALVEQMRRDIRTELKSVEQPGGRGATVSFTLSYRGRDPQIVSLVANTLAGYYQEEDVRMDERRASGTVQALKAQLDEAKKRLEARERRLSGFADMNLGGLPTGIDPNLASLDRLTMQLRMVVEARVRANERREEVLRRLGEAGPASGDPQILIARLNKLNADLESLRIRFSDQYPDVRRVKDEIARIEKQIEEAKSPGRAQQRAEAGRTDASRPLRDALREVDAEIAAAKAEEESLRRQINMYSQRVESAPRRQLALQEVLRDYQANKEVYDTLLKRYEQARLAEGSDGESTLPRFRILDAAVPLYEPVAPARLRLLFMVLVLAAGVAGAAVLAAEQVDRSFHSADELRAFAAVPVLVSVPVVKTRSDRRRRRFRGLLRTAAALIWITLGVSLSHFIAHDNAQLVQLLSRGRS